MPTTKEYIEDEIKFINSLLHKLQPFQTRKEILFYRELEKHTQVLERLKMID